MLGMQEVILILAIILLVFGPSKLPKIARELGKALHEVNKATSMATATLNSENSATRGLPPKFLLDTARKLGLSIEGKTEKQLTDEIFAKILNSKSTLV